MPVPTITWSTTNGGVAITELELGQFYTTPSTGSTKTLHVRHNMANDLTNARIYLSIGEEYQYSPTKSFEEVMTFGDETDGGIQYNLKATTSFPSGDWLTFSTTSGGSSTTSLPLPITAGCPAEGTISAGSSPNIRFGIRFKCPSDTPTITIWNGKFKHVFLNMRFSYTS